MNDTIPSNGIQPAGKILAAVLSVGVATGYASRWIVESAPDIVDAALSAPAAAPFVFLGAHNTVFTVAIMLALAVAFYGAALYLGLRSLVGAENWPRLLSPFWTGYTLIAAAAVFGYVGISNGALIHLAPAALFAVAATSFVRRQRASLLP